ncbi:MAG: signal peptide peptidase SppA [Nocardioidaceae bacterium]
MKAVSVLTSRRSLPVLLELDLTRGLLETPPASPLEAARQRHMPVLRVVISMLRKAAEDDHVVGLVAHIAAKQPTLAQSSELRDSVAAFRAAGKATVCWTESFGEMQPGNVAYHLASAFEQIWLQPSGDVGLTGVVGEAVFVHDALDKLGIGVQIGQRYEYKTAANTFLESGMTTAHKEMAERLVASSMDTVVADVAQGRGLSVTAVRDAVEHAPLGATEAQERGLVDRVGYRGDVYTSLRERLGDTDTRFLHRYRKGITHLVANIADNPPTIGRPTKPVVAVVSVSGAIHLGRSGSSPFGGPSIGSQTLAALLRHAAADDAVRAVVLRVDSPGGSYAASDAIRDEVLALRSAGRLVVASMGSVAGSGGYYISMPADVIVANPGTLTGSIGVLAGKLVFHDALDRIGLHREAVGVGTYAEMFSSNRPYTDDEWARMEAWLDKVYADFTTKAAADRRLGLAELQEVARGRVWTGADAQERGLVDELGGLDHAVDVACDRAGLRRADVVVKVLPKRNPIQRLRPAQNSDSPAASAALSPLNGGATLLQTLGVTSYGVLTMPVVWRIG